MSVKVPRGVAISNWPAQLRLEGDLAPFVGGLGDEARGAAHDGVGEVGEADAEAHALVRLEGGAIGIGLVGDGLAGRAAGGLDAERRAGRGVGIALQVEHAHHRLEAQRLGLGLGGLLGEKGRRAERASAERHREHRIADHSVLLPERRDTIICTQ